jgi:sugar phosphate isomerase/epimerase
VTGKVLQDMRDALPAGTEGLIMHDILKNVQVHMPFHLLYSRFLPMVIRERINPEISFNHASLDGFGRKDFVELADRLLDAGLRITFHAPFMDLRPGAIDPKIRQVTNDRLKQVFDLVPFFRPLSVVCHPSYDQKYYVSIEPLWLENSIDTWRKFLKMAEEMNTVIALENVYERDSHHLCLLLQALPSPRLCFCFDTGHFNVFSRMLLETWIKNIGPRIGQLHLHDNNGTFDEHLPVGKGTFPFQEFFRMIREQERNPIITLESHTEKDLWQMIENIKAMELFA